MSQDSSEVAALSKTAIVRQALRITAHLGEAQLSLERAASYAGVDPATAQAIFQDTPGLIRELNDHLNSRLRALCTEEDARLPEGACAVERLRANMNSYFRFGQEEPAGFAAFIALRWDGEPAIQFEESPNQAEWQWSYAEMLRRTRAVLVEYGAPRSVDLLNRYSLTALAVVHGASHMCVFGAARHLAPAGRRHTMTRVFDVFITGLEYELDGHTQCCIEPVNFRPSQAFSPVPPARQLPRSTDQERTVALYRGGVELLAASTTFDVSIEEAAEQAGLDPAEARRLVDGDNRFDAQIERFLDHQCREATEVFLSNLRADASPFNRIKALGAGYLGPRAVGPGRFPGHVVYRLRLHHPVHLRAGWEGRKARSHAALPRGAGARRHAGPPRSGKYLGALHLFHGAVVRGPRHGAPVLGRFLPALIAGRKAAFLQPHHGSGAHRRG